MTLWNFGNTTVRSPFRLRDGLIAIKNAGLQGNLRGIEQEKRFNLVLSEFGIIEQRGDDTYSVGRKWRSAMTQHGFLYPMPKSKKDSEHLANLGQPDTITPNGDRLINSETVSGWQECFLRSMAAYFVPSYLEKKDILPFSPLRFVLSVMMALESVVGDSKIHFIEMATIIQCSSPETGVESVISQILSLREKREASSQKKQFDQELYKRLAETYGLAFQTFRDYADVNIRYLKATGLFHAKGRGISLSDEKQALINKLVSDHIMYEDNFTYLKRLSEGAPLPFDNKDDALIVLDDLILKLNRKGESYDISCKNLESPAEIAIVRHEIEERLFRLNELEFAGNQVSEIDNILTYLELLITNKSSKEYEDGSILEIPHLEKPAYFEWIIWRLFLAIDSLVNMPWDARRFKVDHDFFPVGTAPGGGPDMIFEFEDVVLVVEVTLTTSSRQEAAEGEPVRRHVAKYAEDFASSGKRVFGLFLAISIDTNTANTFRLGEWYLKDDKKILLDIVPIALSDLKQVVEFYASDMSRLKTLLIISMEECLAKRYQEAPIWKKEISSILEKQNIGLTQFQ